MALPECTRSDSEKPLTIIALLLGTNLKHGPLGVQSIYAGIHDHVQNHEIDFMLLQVSHRLFTAGDACYIVIQFFEHHFVNAGRQVTLLIWPLRGYLGL